MQPLAQASRAVQMTKVFINGLGRIGRSVLRAWAEGATPEVDVVGVNDMAAADLMAWGQCHT